MRRSAHARTAPVLALSLIINSGTMFSLVMGNGVMPIGFSRPLLTALPISFAVAFVSYFVRRWVVLITAALFFHVLLYLAITRGNIFSILLIMAGTIVTIVGVVQYEAERGILVIQ